LHKTLTEVLRDTTDRQYRYVWLPDMVARGEIRLPKIKDPTKDGPPIVTKQMMIDAHKQIAQHRAKPRGKLR
jgi:hypothetical protein